MISTHDTVIKRSIIAYMDYVAYTLCNTCLRQALKRSESIELHCNLALACPLTHTQLCGASLFSGEILLSTPKNERNC